MLKENTTQKDRREYMKRWFFNLQINAMVDERFRQLDELSEILYADEEIKMRRRELRKTIKRFGKARHENCLKLYEVFEELTGINLWNLDPEIAYQKRESLNKEVTEYELNIGSKLLNKNDLFTWPNESIKWQQQLNRDISVYDLAKEYDLLEFYRGPVYNEFE